MEEKNVTKISLLRFFFILAIIIIIVMGIFIYKLYNEKIEANEKSDELQTQVNNLNETIINLQKKIDNISEAIISNSSIENSAMTNSSNNDAPASNDSTLFTDEQVKTALSNFLELRSSANCSGLIEELVRKGNLNYNSSEDISLNDGTVLTTIKFSDYKDAMLNYVSEDEFENNWISTAGFKKSNTGYLIRSQGGGGLRIYTINSITKNDNVTYSANTTFLIDGIESMKGTDDFVFTVKSYNGNCVIDSVK